MNPRSMTSVELTMTNSQSASFVGFPEVLNLNLWFIVPKNVSKPLLPHPLGQLSSFDQFEF